MSISQNLENKTPAYMVAFVRVQNQEEFNRVYLEKAVKIVTKHGGVTIAVADNPPSIEGNMPKGKLVILEFPSMKLANSFYNDPEYQPLKKARMQISQSDSTLFGRGF